MSVTTSVDGSVTIRESQWITRAALLVGAVVVPWGVYATAEGDRLRVALGFLAGGFILAMAALIEDIDYRFDRRERLLWWKRWRLAGGRSGTTPFAAIVAVTLRTRRDTDSPRRPSSIQPILITSDGELPLSTMHSIAPGAFNDLLAAVRTVIAA